MNTKSFAASSAAVTGARHLRSQRNGQDAAAAWVGDGAGAIVVCDGCGSGGSSEVGARLGARLVLGAIAARVRQGARASAIWDGVREDVCAALAPLADRMAMPRADALREHFLFTVVAAVVAGGEVSVWAIGDGTYALGDTARVLGPFADNQPPYLAYDLLDLPRSIAHVETADAASVRSVVVATDGVADLMAADMVRAADDESRLAAFADPRVLANPDALRRRLALAARGEERIDYDERRVIRVPARLEDDGAVAALRWTVPS